MTTQLTDVPIRSAEELTDRWKALLDPPTFDARALWLMWLDDGRQLPLVIPVDGIPPVPDRGMFQGLLHLHEAVAAEHLTGEGHLAMALCRPGRAALDDDDHEWADALHDLLDDGRIDGTWSLHLAAGGQVVPLVDLS